MMVDGNSTQDNKALPLKPRHTVFRLFIIVASSIFATETVLMLVFDHLPRLPIFVGDFLDGLLLTILVSPILYLYLFRPMQTYIAALKEAEGLLARQRDSLEKEVQHRTAELVERNEQQVKLMQELQSAEEKYRNLVEHLPSITYIMSLEEEEGKMLFVSPQIERLGFDANEWIGEADFRSERTHPDDRNDVNQALLHSRETGEPFRCDYRLFSRTNDICWFHDEASVVRDESGKMLYLQGVMLDITEKKSLEEELAEHRYRLERSVKNRTELQERRISVLESANSQLCKIIDELKSRQG
ncbi:MAG: PAS domain-containing protein [Sideroxydans sp.]|nr:PAS domain-containing protein [Sideroxydans sp.]